MICVVLGILFSWMMGGPISKSAWFEKLLTYKLWKSIPLVIVLSSVLYLIGFILSIILYCFILKVFS